MTHGKPKGVGRYVFWGVVSALLAAFIAWSFVPAAVPVDTEAARRDAMAVHIEAEGHTRVNDVYTISAPVTGRLLRVVAEAGDAVKAEKTQLAVLEPADPTILDSRSRAEAEARVQAAEDALALAAAEMDRARAELAFAEAELARAQRLRENETISQRALDLALLDVAKREAALKSAQATAKVREHELETARARLIQPTAAADDGGQCCVKVTAPVDGQVLRVLTKSEGVVQAGTPLMDVGDPRDLEVVVDLLTEDAARVEPGAEVRIGGWGGADLNGRVRRVEPYGYTKVSVLGIEEQRVDVHIDFVDPVPPALGHGFRVDAGILTWRADDVLTVPMSALFRAEDGWAVFAVVDGRARLTRVEVGHMNGAVAELRTGLAAGDEVIVHPSDRVADGVRVRVRDE